MYTIESLHAHPSTLLALEALGLIPLPPPPLAGEAGWGNFNTLDIGCGNGVLSIVAAQRFGGRVLAVDISANAVADTKKALSAFNPPLAVECRLSDGLKHPEISARAPYDLIICNLLAEQQVSMAHGMKKLLRPSIPSPPRHFVPSPPRHSDESRNPAKAAHVRRSFSVGGSAAKKDLYSSLPRVKLDPAFQRDDTLEEPVGGHLLLSGILAWQKALVMEAFISIGFVEIQSLNASEWHAVLFSAPKPNRL